MYVWVMFGVSESGDSYGPWVFSQEPSEEEQRAVLEKKVGDDWDPDGNGPGTFGSYVYVDVSKCLVDELV